MRTKTLFILSGVPGCGKSTWAKEFCNGRAHTAYISRDAIRFKLLAEHEEYFNKEYEVINEYFKTINEALADESITSIVVDATHINYYSRQNLFAHLNIDAEKVTTICVYFKVPVEVCLQRNANRTGRELVPEVVIRRFYRTLTNPRSDGSWKFFNEIWIVNAKGEVKKYERVV